MSKVHFIPAGYSAVTPYMIVKGAAQAIDFYKTHFGAVEELRMEHEGKVGHAELRIGDSHIMLADEYPEMGHRSPLHYGGTPLSLMVYVPNVDAVFAGALRAGAKELKPVQDQFYGDRSGTLTDPFGHMWTIATHVEDVPPKEMERRARAQAEKK